MASRIKHRKRSSFKFNLIHDAIKNVDETDEQNIINQTQNILTMFKKRHLIKYFNEMDRFFFDNIKKKHTFYYLQYFLINKNYSNIILKYEYIIELTINLMKMSRNIISEKEIDIFMEKNKITYKNILNNIFSISNEILSTLLVSRDTFLMYNLLIVNKTGNIGILSIEKIIDYINDNNDYDGIDYINHLNIYVNVYEQNKINHKYKINVELKDKMILIVKALLNKGFYPTIYTPIDHMYKLFVDYGCINNKIFNNCGLQYIKQTKCEVCFKTIKKQFVCSSVGIDCNHNVCTDCLHMYVKHVKGELETNKINFRPNAPCCNNILKPNMVADLARQFNIEINSKALCLLVLSYRASKNPNFTICPNDECDGYAFVDQEEEKIMRCLFCVETQRFVGRNYDNSHLNENAHLLKNKNFKRCPTCQRIIEKNGGCNHMICNFCKSEFNWNEVIIT